jgi:pimeloyl-ACP methyl ester carboxylesterase
MAELPLILLPGMAATRECFAPQFEDFPELVVPDWIEPLPNESLAEYAKRFAAVIDPGMPCVIGGMSFGGIVATELCKHLDAKALVLIASLQSPDERPRRARWLCRLLGLLPSPLVWCGQRLAQLLLVIWSARALANWQASDPPIPCPVHRLHGERDPALPARCAPNAEIVPGGRHVLTLSHPRCVRELIRDALNTRR